MKKYVLLATLLVAIAGTMHLSAAVNAASQISIRTDGGATELANPNLVPDETKKDNADGTGLERYYFNTTTDSWFELTDPMRVGYTFAGWQSNYVTNHQYLSDTEGNALPLALSSYNNPINLADVPNQYYQVGQIGGNNSTGSDVSEFTKQLTVNVWAYKKDWSDYYVYEADGTTHKKQDGRLRTKRIISCTQGSGWNIGEADESGNIRWPLCQDNTGTGWEALLNSTTTYHDLASGWHMFTLTWNKEQGYLRAYIDGVKFDEVKNVTTIGYRTPGSDYVTVDGKTAVPITIGAEPNGDGTVTADQFFADSIKNLIIIRERLVDAVAEKLYNEPSKTYVYTNTSTHYKFGAGWIQNPKTTLTIDLKDGSTAATSENNGGKSVAVADPAKRNDYVFKHWSGDAADYISNYQGIEYVQADGTTPADIFTRPENGGETNVVNFDGATHYFVKDQRHKYTDCFTVNVWARMDNWQDYQTGNMRMFSCSHSAGFNIEPIASTGQISFIGRDKGNNTWKKANTATTKTWESLGQDKWHMFTYVFDGNYVRGYVDGECVAISERFEGNGMKHTDNHIVIGGEAQGTRYAAETTQHFKGDMKNFAIMHVALAPSQVKDLYTNKGATRYYYASANKTLEAEWTALPLLEAADVTLHAIDQPVKQTIAVKGNGKKAISLTLAANTQFALSTTAIAEPTGGDIEITFTPGEKESETTTYTIASEGSTEKTYNLKGYKHTFKVTKWTKEGFYVETDLSLDGDATVIEIQGGTPKATMDATSGAYFIPLANVETLLGQDIALTITNSVLNLNLSTTVTVPTSAADLEDTDDTTTDLSSIQATFAVYQDAPLHIRVKGLQAGDEVRIIDATGRVVCTTVACAAEEAFLLPAEGAYFVQMVGQENTDLKKIIVSM